MDKPKRPPPIAEINERNRVFWEEQMARFRKRVEERPEDVKRALERLSHEDIKETPIRSRSSLEEIVFDYEEVEIEHNKARQRRAAKASRQRRENPIHDFIDRRLSQNPEATAKEIWGALLDDANSGASGDFQTVGEGIEVTDDPAKNAKPGSNFDVLVSKRRKNFKRKSYR
jgi:hypothetical protein